MFTRFAYFISALLFLLLGLLWFNPIQTASTLPASATSSSTDARLPSGLSEAEWASIQSQINQTAYTPNTTEVLGTGQIAKLTAETPMPNDWFGGAVAVSGDIVAVGAQLVDIGGQDNAGAVFVFYRNIGPNGVDNWGLVKKVTASDGLGSDEFGFSVGLSGDTLIVGAHLADVSGRGDQGAAYVFTRNQGGINNWGQVAKLTAVDGTSGDQFGSAVAINGDTAVVGATNDGAGSAYVFLRNQDGTDAWGQKAKMTPSDGVIADNFGYSVSISGDIIAVGAYLDDNAVTPTPTPTSTATNTPGPTPTPLPLPPTNTPSPTPPNLPPTNTPLPPVMDQGAVYIFYRNDGGADAWGQRTKVLASDAAGGDHFGASVSVSGDTLLVGAPLADVNGHTDQGAAYLFSRNQGGGNTWGQIKKITISDAHASDWFGISLSLSGDTALVGAQHADLTAGDQGAAYLFERNQESGWGEVTRLVASDPLTSSVFGHAVALSGNTLVVGAYRDDTNGNSDAGSAYVFYQTGTEWQQIAKPNAATGQAGDQLGSAVALFNDTLVVGAPNADIAGADSGAAYLFERNTVGPDAWQLVKALTPPDGVAGDHFGRSVTVYDDTAVIGAPDKNSGQGAVYIFVRNQPTADNWGWRKTLSGVVGDKFGWSVSLSGDLLAVGAPNPASMGSVYLYERNQGGADTWDVTKHIITGALGDQFGYAVSLDIDTLLASSPYADPSSLNNAGTAGIYERNTDGPENWGLVKELTASDGAADDHFGLSVALSDDTAVVGAPDVNRGADAEVGAAYIFLRNNGNWGQRAILTDATGVANDRFGFSVAIRVDTVLVGAPRVMAGGNANQGIALLFERNIGGGDAWGEMDRLAADDGAAEDRFGYAVALGSEFAVSGALNAKIGANSNQGAAYVFHWTGGMPHLLVALNGTGYGYVTSVPSGIDCGMDCEEAFPYGTAVTLTAMADPLNTFMGWSGACRGLGSCVVLLNASQSVTATFDKAPRIVVTPDSLTAVQAPEAQTTQTVTIENTGLALLIWQRDEMGGLTEGFDTIATIFTQNWVKNNHSQPLGTSDWSQGNASIFPAHSGADNSFIAANFYNTSGVGTISNWLLTPVLSLNDGDTFSFWTRTPTNSTYADRLQVRMSTNGASTDVGNGAMDVGDFTTLSLDINPTLQQHVYPEVWTQYTITVSGVGPTPTLGRFAFRYFVENGGNNGANSNYIGIDTVTFTEGGSVGCQPYPWFNLVGVPVNPSNPPGASTAVSAVFDSTGLAAGSYSGLLCIRSNDPESPLVTVPLTLTVEPPQMLTVSLAGTGQGSVASNPAGIDCGVDCSETYAYGTVVTLTATAVPSSTFAGWSGACVGVGQCVIRMNTTQAATATFTEIPPDSFPLTVLTAGSGAGTVTSTPAGINCGSDCSEIYAANTEVTLTATPANGSTFVGWSGDCSGTGSCVVTMAAAHSVTATFDEIPPVLYDLTVTESGTGSGFVTSAPAGINCGVDCSETYLAGTVVTLTATANNGSLFSGWTGDCSGAGLCVVTMSAAHDVTATFDEIPPNSFGLTVLKSGAGDGTITSTPAGIDCGLDCTEVYPDGTVVTLTVTAVTGSTFVGWSAPCSGSGDCVVTLNQNTEVTATFAANPSAIYLPIAIRH